MLLPTPDRPRGLRIPRLSRRPLRVAVLLGGDSEERAISLKSGFAVLEALRSRGHSVAPLDPQLVHLTGVDWRQFDVAFIALHGSFGEDGEVQHLLDEANMVYTGSGAPASALAFSKWATKCALHAAALPTAAAVLVHRHDDLDAVVDATAPLGWPMVVKPDAQGSSVGVTLARHVDELKQGVAAALRLGRMAIVERALLGQEWTVAVLDDEPLPALRIASPQLMFDYQQKYVAPDTQKLFASTPSEQQLAQQLEDLAAKTCHVLGTRGLARVDIRLDEHGQPQILEANTVPGLTERSLAPLAAERAGLAFPELCERMLALALAGSQAPPQRAAG